MNSDQKVQPSVGVLALDQQGALIINAEVTFADRAGKILLQSKTDSNGRLQWSSMAPGSYIVTIKAPGFKTFTKKLEVKDKPVELRAQLKIAKVTETVEVGGVSPAVQGYIGVSVSTPSATPMGQGAGGRPAPLRQ